MQFTGERILGNQWKGDIRFADHLERYNFAADYCTGKVVLDIACGTGYWSHIMSKVAKSVTGVDVDKFAVENAQKQYKADNLRYLLGDWETIPMDDASVDIAVSFETIEHIVNYDHFLQELKRVLKPGGMLLMSTPNFRWEIVKNKYHVSNFTTESFVSAVEKHFTLDEVCYQGKHFYPIPGRGILEALLRIKKDVKIRSQKPDFHHHVTIVKATKN